MGESDVDTLDINHLQLGDAHRSLAGPDPLLKKLETIAAAQHSSLILKSQELIIPSLDVELHSWRQSKSWMILITGLSLW